MGKKLNSTLIVKGRRFKIVVKRGEDGYLISKVVGLPGCHTQAKTYDGLLKRTKEVIDLYLSFKKSEKVYSLLKQVPRGKVTTYKALARASGLYPREVGRTLSRNPYAPRVPCHRVVRADGSLGGYTHKGRQNPALKMRILKREGVEFLRGRVRKDNLFKF